VDVVRVRLVRDGRTRDAVRNARVAIFVREHFASAIAGVLGGGRGRFEFGWGRSGGAFGVGGRCCGNGGVAGWRDGVAVGGAIPRSDERDEQAV